MNGWIGICVKMRRWKSVKSAMGWGLWLWALVWGTAVLPLKAAELPLRIGYKNFSEQALFGELLKQFLQAKGYAVELHGGWPSRELRRALESHQIDLAIEYTGSAFQVHQQQARQNLLQQPDRLLKAIREHDAPHGLVWLEPMAANHTQALLMPAAKAKTLGLVTISDLAAYLQKEPQSLRLGAPAEFYTTENGWEGLRTLYHLELPRNQLKKLRLEEIFEAFAAGSIEFGLGGATDPRILSGGLIALEDDQVFFPDYSPAVVLTQPTLERFPALRQQLAALTLDTLTLRRLNFQIEIEKQPISQVAKRWLQSAGMLP